MHQDRTLKGRLSLSTVDGKGPVACWGRLNVAGDAKGYLANMDTIQRAHKKMSVCDECWLTSYPL